MNTHDTIAAIATPIGSGGIGVIRISGPESVDIASQVFKHNIRNFASHTAHYGTLTHPATAEAIDDVVTTLFLAPKSYTGEDVIEISCHGGISTVKAALNAVLTAGARLAEPGEFTKRAFLNGRLDLAQAEAVNDLIRAHTDEARKVALRQLDGKLSEQVRGINHKVLGVIAAVEAAIDFPDDVPEPDEQWVASEITEARSSVDALLVSSDKGRILREGLRVVIAGKVNVGKSSLLNALLRHARAIVTPIPGTTRDVIEESLEISGIPIVAIDTAGVRSTNDPVEQIGVELSRQSIESADIVLLVVDISADINEEDIQLYAQAQGKRIIMVINKIDLVSDADRSQIIEHHTQKLGGNHTTVQVSASQGQGIELLENKIAELVSANDMGSESVMVSNIRHKQALQSASESLTQVLATLNNQEPIDLLSVDLVAARNSLGLITGETANEDLLDRIFSEFCIGK